MQYTFMNIFTSIFFEEQRVISMYEEVIYLKYDHLRRKKTIRVWISGLCACYNFFKSKANLMKVKKKDGDDLEAVNVLRDKMK